MSNPEYLISRRARTLSLKKKKRGGVNSSTNKGRRVPHSLSSDYTTSYLPNQILDHNTFKIFNDLHAFKCSGLINSNLSHAASTPVFNHNNWAHDVRRKVFEPRVLNHNHVTNHVTNHVCESPRSVQVNTKNLGTTPTNANVCIISRDTSLKSRDVTPLPRVEQIYPNLSELRNDPNCIQCTPNTSAYKNIREFSCPRGDLPLNKPDTQATSNMESNINQAGIKNQISAIQQSITHNLTSPQYPGALVTPPRIKASLNQHLNISIPSSQLFTQIPYPETPQSPVNSLTIAVSPLSSSPCSSIRNTPKTSRKHFIRQNSLTPSARKKLVRQKSLPLTCDEHQFFRFYTSSISEPSNQNHHGNNLIIYHGNQGNQDIKEPDVVLRKGTRYTDLNAKKLSYIKEQDSSMSGESIDCTLHQKNESTKGSKSPKKKGACTNETLQESGGSAVFSNTKQTFHRKPNLSNLQPKSPTSNRHSIDSISSSIGTASNRNVSILGSNRNVSTSNLLRTGSVVSKKTNSSDASAPILVKRIFPELVESDDEIARISRIDGAIPCDQESSSNTSRNRSLRRSSATEADDFSTLIFDRESGCWKLYKNDIWEEYIRDGTIEDRLCVVENEEDEKIGKKEKNIKKLSEENVSEKTESDESKLHILTSYLTDDGRKHRPILDPNAHALTDAECSPMIQPIRLRYPVTPVITALSPVTSKTRTMCAVTSVASTLNPVTPAASTRGSLQSFSKKHPAFDPDKNHLYSETSQGRAVSSSPAKDAAVQSTYPDDISLSRSPGCDTNCMSCILKSHDSRDRPAAGSQILCLPAPPSEQKLDPDWYLSSSEEESDFSEGDDTRQLINRRQSSAESGGILDSLTSKFMQFIEENKNSEGLFGGAAKYLADKALDASHHCSLEDAESEEEEPYIPQRKRIAEDTLLGMLKIQEHKKQQGAPGSTDLVNGSGTVRRAPPPQYKTLLELTAAKKRDAIEKHKVWESKKKQKDGVNSQQSSNRSSPIGGKGRRKTTNKS